MNILLTMSAVIYCNIAICNHLLIVLPNVCNVLFAIKLCPVLANSRLINRQLRIETKVSRINCVVKMLFDDIDNLLRRHPVKHCYASVAMFESKLSFVEVIVEWYGMICRCTTSSKFKTGCAIVCKCWANFNQ